ncbi:LysR family transcriptional regulator [Edwardsiella ictaluri]|uniref:LysR substrate binding domain protein n=2 Tax=Edwardsiella ictaluri TaxID=67780 RepID=C5BEB7_EDWI9|nr:LysR family transcriptional regulator [Edwardsiella ictaluri]ACR69678.2 LysR substrate binding domain protein [Edwardsiella ictaluri 93-146]ARD38777.1 LysR family transcriptional regulator [Edwardsiella ictaluri]AVZ83337.1 LysR family transcriptional regulator [Edwardsiella ictaluri]EKS7761782.1 LysR family transcriptional regulator [Edwardsiella ictaluri]EKS7768592.1 LysR family transcriptional regulator [Edwardsiella ictaluri]
MNWDDTQYLLALAREKTLRKAAARLFVDQATVARRIVVLENQLKCKLFLRSNKGYELTPVGNSAVDEAENVERAVALLVKKVTDYDQQLSGDVVISTTDSVAVDFITTAVKELGMLAPGIRIKLDASTALCDMTRRGVDIAIRNIRPNTPDLVTKQLLTSPMKLYASAEYVQTHGYPDGPSPLDDRDVVIYAPMLAHCSSTLFGLSLEHARIAFLADSSLLLRDAIKKGIGVGFLPAFMAERDHLVALLDADETNSNYELWLVTHTDTLNSARIQIVMKTLNKLFYPFQKWPTPR